MEVEDRISFQEVAGALKRRWRLLVALPLALAAITSAITLLQRRDYKATAILLASVSKLQTSGSVDNFSDIRTRTAVRLIPHLVPAEQVARKFGLDAEPYSVPADRLWGGFLKVQALTNTRLLHLSATTPEPELSRDLANYVADRVERGFASYGQSDAAQTAKYLKEHLAAAKRRMDSAEDALLKFDRTARLSELIQDVNTLLNQRDRLLLLRFENDLRLKDGGRDDLLREKEEVLKLLRSDDGFSELKILAGRNDDLLAFRRALSGKMLEAKSELSGVLEAANGGLGAGARNESVKNAGADDAVRAAAALEKIRAEKKALEDERRSASAALPALEIEIQVSGSKLKALKKTMERARRAGAASGGERASLAAPRENGALDGGDAFDARRGAVAARIVNEELRLVELAEKKRQYEKRIARIDSELPATAERLRRRKAKYLLLEISRMAGEIKGAEAEILANERKMAERRARRRSLLAKAGALGDAALDIGKLESPFAPPYVSAQRRGFDNWPADGFPTDRSISERFGDRLRSLDKGILTAAHLRRRRKWLDARLKEVREKIREKSTERANLVSRRDKLQLERRMTSESYTAASNTYDQAETLTLSGETRLSVASRAELPRRPAPRHLAIKASLSLILGLFLAACAALFLEFRKTEPAREEPGSA